MLSNMTQLETCQEYKLLSTAPHTSTNMLVFTQTNKYMRKQGDGLQAAPLQIDDQTFLFEVRLYAAVSMCDSSYQRIYSFHSERLRVCESPDGKKLQLKDVSVEQERRADVITANEVGYFIDINVDCNKAFESIKWPGRYLAYNQLDGVHLTEALSADTHMQLHAK